MSKEPDETQEDSFPTVLIEWLESRSPTNHAAINDLPESFLNTHFLIVASQDGWLEFNCPIEWLDVEHYSTPSENCEHFTNGWGWGPLHVRIGSNMPMKTALLLLLNFGNRLVRVRATDKARRELRERKLYGDKAADGQAPAGGDDAEEKPESPKDEEDTESKTPETLTDRQLEVLEAMRLLKATSRKNRQTAKDIAKKAVGVADPDKVKEPLAQLTQWRYVESMQGRKGGSWMTKEGRRRLSVEKRKQ